MTMTLTMMMTTTTTTMMMMMMMMVMMMTTTTTMTTTNYLAPFYVHVLVYLFFFHKFHDYKQVAKR